MEETRSFFESVLDFKVTDAAGTITAEKHGAKLIFTTQDLWQSQPVFSGTIYFTVPDADGFFSSIKDTVTVARPIQDMPYGSRDFGIKDCNGYHLAFQQQVWVESPPIGRAAAARRPRGGSTGTRSTPVTHESGPADLAGFRRLTSH